MVRTIFDALPVDAVLFIAVRIALVDPRVPPDLPADAATERAPDSESHPS
jgi:hypothetical protein